MVGSLRRGNVRGLLLTSVKRAGGIKFGPFAD